MLSLAPALQAVLNQIFLGSHCSTFLICLAIWVLWWHIYGISWKRSAWPLLWAATCRAGEAAGEELRWKGLWNHWAASLCAAKGICCSWRSELASFGREQRGTNREERGKWSDCGRCTVDISTDNSGNRQCHLNYILYIKGRLQESKGKKLLWKTLAGTQLWLTPEWMHPKSWSLHAKEVTAERTALVLTGLSLHTSLKGTSLFSHNPRVLASLAGKNVPWEH